MPPSLTVDTSRSPASSPIAGPRMMAIDRLHPSRFSLAVYGEPGLEVDDLMVSIQLHGILVPLVVAPEAGSKTFEVLSGHRRLACARALGLAVVPCEVRTLTTRTARRRAVLEYNRQRQKSFSQRMREADALEALLTSEARRNRLANLRQYAGSDVEINQDDRPSVGIPTLGAIRITHRVDGHPVREGEPMSPSPARSGSAARTSTARPAPSGGWPGRATSARGRA